MTARRLKARWPQVVLAGVAAAGFAAPAAGQSAPNLQLPVEFFLGGVQIGEAYFVSEPRGDGYRIDLTLETDGVVDWFFQAAMRSVVEGGVSGERFAPASWDLDVVSDEGDFVMRVDYVGDAPSEVSAEPPFDPRPWQIDPTAQSRTLDPLSAILMAMAPRDRDDLCDITLPIFDGRRRYDVVIDRVIRETDRDDGVVRIDCGGSYRRIAGFKPRFMEMDDIDFRVRFDLLPDGSVRPIRAWSDTEFGAAVAVVRD